jgi:tetratricopeptide (TPR) repeat protein
MLIITYLVFEITREKKWAALMGLLWFLLFAIPPTIYRLENADVFFNYLEHRTYLPMIGIVVILGFFVDEHLSSAAFSKRLPWLFIPVILIFSALAWIHCGDYENNFTLSMRAASLNNPSGFSMRAADYMEKKDTTNAMVDINKAIEMSPKDANMYFARGNIMARMQRHVEAEQDFSMALGLNTGLVGAYLARSVERRIMKKYESAFRDIFAAATYDSANPKVYFSFGNLFLAVNNYANADSSFSKAIKLQPQYAEAYNNRAYTRLFLGNFAGTISDCDSALRLMASKPSPVTYNNLARAYRELNQFDSAFKYFNNAIKIKNDFPEGYFERGVAKFKTNDKEGACKDWKSALAFGYKDSTNMLNKYCN